MITTRSTTNLYTPKLNNIEKSYLKFFEEVSGKTVRYKGWVGNKIFIPCQIDSETGCFYGYLNDANGISVTYTPIFIEDMSKWEIL
jgi:hypothetical protein